MKEQGGERKKKISFFFKNHSKFNNTNTSSQHAEINKVYS